MGYSLERHSPTQWEAVMARCETCGNDYDKAFQVSMNGATHTFDSFECAIHALAPTCDNCGIHIVGHGLEKEGTFFCCEHCAEVKGVLGLRDRIGAGGVIEMGSRYANRLALILRTVGGHAWCIQGEPLELPPASP